MPTIVKVQRPLIGPMARKPADQIFLIYDKRQKHHIEQKIETGPRKAMEDSHNEFFEATWDEEHQKWNLGRKVPYRNW